MFAYLNQRSVYRFSLFPIHCRLQTRMSNRNAQASKIPDLHPSKEETPTAINQHFHAPRGIGRFLKLAGKHFRIVN